VRLWNTYFITSNEDDYAGPRDTPVYATNGSVIAMVPSAFFQDLCVEGAGRLSDGRVINIAGQCSYGVRCNATHSGPSCYHVIDSTRAPWGHGSHSNPLVPLRSLATYPSDIPYGSYVYLPRWRGIEIPRVGDLGGFTHDGCFRADDVGGWIGSGHIDIFAGSKQMMQALERIFPTRSQFEASISPVSCAAAMAAVGDTPLVAAPSTQWLVAGAVVFGSAVAYYLWQRGQR